MGTAVWGKGMCCPSMAITLPSSQRASQPGRGHSVRTSSTITAQSREEGSVQLAPPVMPRPHHKSAALDHSKAPPDHAKAPSHACTIKPRVMTTHLLMPRPNNVQTTLGGSSPITSPSHSSLCHNHFRPLHTNSPLGQITPQPHGTTSRQDATGRCQVTGPQQAGGHCSPPGSAHGPESHSKPSTGPLGHRVAVSTPGHSMATAQQVMPRLWQVTSRLQQVLPSPMRGERREISPAQAR